ncbi:Clp protease N-terminal domain-containing protein [Pseudonocardia sp. ICBG1293]|uniref:Clp protease N-terminal domain-containing protein n=1 Tax=Pseudonocardia sp. ICBG1293 TaxID=2844382 RepID=UPI001CCF89AC|nr:Clp protease N-terminal domain-containing protein [Pseudonocardia sp. ICBG1293]
MNTPTPPGTAVRLDDLIRAVTAAHHDPLEQLSDAVLTGDHLGEVADHLIGHFVDRARRSGASWTEIGRSMGVSKQAAQKRFVPRGDAADDMAGGFERFTPRARGVVVAAQESARAAGNDRITREHLLLGLLAETHGLAVLLLTGLGTDTGALGEAATAALPAPADTQPALIPFDPTAKKSLELTLRHTLRLGHHYVGTEHVLLALLETEDGDGVLSAAGVDAARVEEALEQALTAMADPGTS